MMSTVSRHDQKTEQRRLSKEVEKMVADARKNPLLMRPEEYVRLMTKITLPLKDIYAMVNMAYEHGDAGGCYHTYMYAMAAALMALRDEFHFGHDRGQRFIDRMKSNLAFSIDGDEDVAEIYRTMGIDVDIRDIVSQEDAEKYRMEIEDAEERIRRVKNL